MQDIAAPANLNAMSVPERLQRLKGRADALAEMPMFAQPAAAREIVSDALVVMIDLAVMVEDLTPFADEDLAALERAEKYNSECG